MSIGHSLKVVIVFTNFTMHVYFFRLDREELSGKKNKKRKAAELAEANGLIDENASDEEDEDDSDFDDSQLEKALAGES